MTVGQMNSDQNIEDLTPGLTAPARKFMLATGSKVEIEDIIQEAFITLWKLKESGYEGVGHKDRQGHLCITLQEAESEDGTWQGRGL